MAANWKKVGVVGCGLMGSGIVEVCARSGMEVVVREADPGFLEKGLARVKKSIDTGVERKKLTPEDIRFRFLSPRKEFSHKTNARFTQIDYGRAMAFIALRMDQSELLGVARLEADPDYVSAEYAVIVRSDLKGAGLGWALMRHLIRYAESEGLRDLHGDVLAANVRMLQMCRELGFDVAADPEDLSLRKVRLKLPLAVATG